MAIRARSPRLLPVLLMACQTPDALVDAVARSIVARPHLPRGQRRVALIAQPLPLVRTYGYDFSDRQQGANQRR